MKNAQLAAYLILAFTCLVCAGCSGTYRRDIQFNPSEPLRIAVLPFAEVDDSGALIQADADLLIDSVNPLSTSLKQTPAQFMQSLVENELRKASLDVVVPAIVDADLVHGGYGVPDTKPVVLDFAKIFAADPTQLCSTILTCDAVLYGKVTEWDRSYYGVEAVATVGLELKLVSAKTKKVLFSTESIDSDSRGLSKGPTGFSNIVLEPLKGLDNEIITTLAREIVEETLKPLHRENRPEFLNKPAPFIISSAHDASSGVISRTEHLTVVAFGSPGATASFSIGSRIKNIPLAERAPGHYVGEFIPLPSDSFQNEYVVVALKDGVGRTSTQRLAKTPVSLPF
jgi:hypothetical protein